MKDSVSAHYSHGQLLEQIRRGVEAIGKTAATVTVDELAMLAPCCVTACGMTVCRSPSATIICDGMAITCMDPP